MLRKTTLLLLLLAGAVAAEPPRPHGPPPPAGPPHPPPLDQRLTELKHQLETQNADNVSAQRALQYARRYLHMAQSAYSAGKRGRADRLAAVSDALLHVAEHQRHLASIDEAKAIPPVEAVRNHLQQVYFRTEQARYFLEEAHDRSASPLPDWARGFYQLAVRAYDRKDLFAAEENAKCADDVVRALENLAQAANLTGADEPPPPVDAPPPPPPAPPGPQL